MESTPRHLSHQLELDLPVPAVAPMGTVTAIAFAYALAFFQRAPGHWARTGVIEELERRLDQIQDEKWRKVIQKTAQRHVSELLPRKKKR
jgi:hypothetical protein